MQRAGARASGRVIARRHNEALVGERTVECREIGVVNDGVPVPGYKDALADGAMSGCCIGLVRRCALAGRHGLRFEGSRLNHCDHCARGVWRVPRQAAGFGRAADAIQRGNLDFMPANPPEDALF